VDPIKPQDEPPPVGKSIEVSLRKGIPKVIGSVSGASEVLWVAIYYRNIK
jgi:hypothetical protein